MIRGPQRWYFSGRPSARSMPRGRFEQRERPRAASRIPIAALTKSDCATGPNGFDPYNFEIATTRVVPPGSSRSF